MPRTTSNIHRTITLAAVTVATAITFSTIARADDSDRIRRDAGDVQQDRQNTARDTNQLLRDATQGGDVGRDLDRLRQDSRDRAEDNARLNRDVNSAVGDPGDVDAMARTKNTPMMHPQNVTTQRPQGQK